MGLNIDEIRRAVEEGIQVSPTNISIKRDNRVDDFAGGYTIDLDNPIIEVVNIDILLNEGTSSQNQTKYSEGGKREDITGITALVPYYDTFTIKKGDFFDVNGKTYFVTYPLNMYSAYWTLHLEVRINE